MSTYCRQCLKNPRKVLPCELNPLIYVPSCHRLLLRSNNNGHLISPNATGAISSGQQRFSGSQSTSSSSSQQNHHTKRNSEVVASSLSSAAAAMRLLSSNQSGSAGGQVSAKRSRSRSPAVAVPSTTMSNKASINNPSLAASLAAVSQQSPHDHSANSAQSSSSAAAAGQSSLISSFLTGLPASMFTPMIDMTSTQALVTLVSRRIEEREREREMEAFVKGSYEKG